MRYYLRLSRSSSQILSHFHPTGKSSRAITARARSRSRSWLTTFPLSHDTAEVWPGPHLQGGGPPERVRVLQEGVGPAGLIMWSSVAIAGHLLTYPRGQWVVPWPVDVFVPVFTIRTQTAVDHLGGIGVQGVGVVFDHFRRPRLALRLGFCGVLVLLVFALRPRAASLTGSPPL